MSNIQFGENSGIKEGQKFNSRKDFVDAWKQKRMDHGFY